MSDPHATDVPGREASAGADHHTTIDHGDEHGHDDHGHDDEEAVGPVDAARWGAWILGVAIAVLIAACFAFAPGSPG